MDQNKPMIRHIAIVTLNPHKLADFYVQTFDMKRLHSDGQAVYVTDGYITMALLPQNAEGKPNGLNHFGFQVPNSEEIASRMEKAGMKRPAKRPADRPYAESRGTDPDGNNFDISVHGFQTVELADERDRRKEKVGV